MICFQELFYGPYFGIVAGPEVLPLRRAGPRPDRRAVPGAGQGARPGDRAADLRGGERGRVLQHRRGDRRRRHLLGKYRKHHLPNLPQFWEKFYFRPGNLGYPVFDTAVGRVGVYICYDRHFPEGWRELGLNGAQIVFNPSATKPGLSNRLWELEQPAAAAANQYFVARQQPGRPARTRSSATRPSSSTARATSSTRAATSSATSRRPTTRRSSSATSTSTRSPEIRNDWQFYRDRRPDSYAADRGSHDAR